MTLANCSVTTASETRNKMNATPSSIEHLSVAMTTETLGDVTAAMTSPPSRGIAFYFQCAVVVIGVVGMAANALILYALVASEEHKKHMLIFNQNLLDCFTCLLLISSYSLKLRNIYLTGLGGYWLCMLFTSENLLWCSIDAAKTNLMIITIERYLKVVYPTWSKKKVGKWVLYSAMAFAWISGFANMFSVTLATSDVIDGVCYAYAFWLSPTAHKVYVIWSAVSYYVVLLLIFIFCYWRILVVIRRQASVMAGHGASATTQVQSQQIQTNVIKTMVPVCAVYAIADFPLQAFGLLHGFAANIARPEAGYYATLFLSFFYICANPFIYAVKFDPVKRVLLRLIPVCQTSVQSAESAEMNVARATTSQCSGQSGK